MDWRKLNLYGAGCIARICGLYEVTDTRIPGAKFKIKVMERDSGDFMACLNVCLKAPDGSPDWMVGLGRTDLEALEDALKRFTQDLSSRERVDDDDFEWSDPIDF
ncbi:hypothetical protein [Sorangium sp. So ce394]|uniref:hypothetical protein n=1 Tax=Sorangium sp. So ce394 TaxID=3133310 RepID=UPI003F5C58EA